MNQLTNPQADTLLGMQSPEPPENPHSPLRRLVDAAFRSWGLLVMLAFLGAIVGAGAAILKPNEFVSTATFLFQYGSEQVPVKPTGELPRDWGRNFGVTENAPHVLVSPVLARRTVERVGVAKVFQPFKPSVKSTSWLQQQIHALQGRIHDRDPSVQTVSQAVEEFLSHITVTGIRHAQLLSVSYQANDPHLAQEVLEAYVAEATKFHIETYNPKTAMVLVETSHRTAKAAYLAAKVEHERLLKRSGLTNFEIEFGALQVEAAQARKALRTLVEEEIPSLEIQIKEGEKALAGMKPRIERTVQVPVPNQLIGQLELRRLEAEDALLAARNTFKRDDSPEVQRVLRRISQLDAKLKTERERPPVLVDTTESVVNEEYTVVRSRIETARIKLLVARQNIEPHRKRAEALLEERDRIAALASDYRNASGDLERTRQALQVAESQLAQAHAKQELAENELSTLRIVNPPTFTPTRVGPRRSQMTILGLLGGLVLGLAFVGMRALTDTTIRTPEELEQMVGLRVLATVPDLRRKKHVRRHENRILSGC